MCLSYNLSKPGGSVGPYKPSATWTVSKPAIPWLKKKKKDQIQVYK